MSKIGIFSAQVLPFVGGIQRYTDELAKELARRGHKVYIITSDIYGGQPVSHKGNITFINMPCFPLLKGRLPIVKRNKRFLTLRRYIENIGLDFIIINARFYTHSVFGARLALKNNIKSICIDHGSDYIAFNKPIIDPMVHLYEHLITLVMKRYCKRYYAVSRDGSKWLKTFGIRSMGEVHNSINVRNIEEEISNYKGDNEPLDENCGPVISYVGRVIERKGILELDRAVYGLKGTYPGIRLIIAGDGELMSTLRRVSHDTTIIAGTLAHDAAMNLIKRSDVFVLASETEGFPTSVLEAFACKTFVITTYVGGSKEIIRDRSFGLLIKDNSSESIRKALKYALADDDYRKNAAQKSYNYVKNYYSWSKAAEQIEKIIAGD